MPDGEAEVLPDGVKGEKIIIHAASPDVLARVCQEITDRVMALIPDDAFTKIAEEVLDGNDIMVRQRRSFGSGMEDKVLYSLGDAAKEEVAKKLRVQTQKLVGEFWNAAKTQETVRVLAAEAFGQALKQLPRIMGEQFVERMSMVGFNSTPPNFEFALGKVGDRLQRLVEHLQYNTNAMLPDDVVNPQ